MSCYKLAFIIERYFEFGGLQRDMRRLALACAQAGHAVTVYTGQWEGPAETQFRTEIVNFRQRTNHGTLLKIHHFVQTLKQQKQYDCIVGFNRVGGLDVYFAGDVCLKSKLQEQSRGWLRFLPRYHTYLKLEEAVFGKNHATELMVISGNEADKIRRLYQTPENRIHVLPPGIDRHRLLSDPLGGEKRRQFRKDLGTADQDLMLLTVGSSFHTKGIDRVISAIAALPADLKNRCRYVVVGRGDEKVFAQIATQNHLDGQVLFTGGRRDISNFYHASDLLVHPARTENTGTTLLEAIVAGLPVITTENCGYAHYIRQADAGRVCPMPYAQSQLNQYVCELLSNDQKRAELGANGQRYSQTADLYSMIEKAAEVIVRRAGMNRGRR